MNLTRLVLHLVIEAMLLLPSRLAELIIFRPIYYVINIDHISIIDHVIIMDHVMY